RVWPPCLEFQIQRGDVGDIWALLGTHGVLKHGYHTKKIHKGDYVRAKKFADGEWPGWNLIRLEVRGNSARLYVNGVLVNRIIKAAYKGNPLTSGHIALEAEQAEISYRHVMIQQVYN